MNNGSQHWDFFYFVSMDNIVSPGRCLEKQLTDHIRRCIASKCDIVDRMTPVGLAFREMDSAKVLQKSKHVVCVSQLQCLL